MQTRPMHDAVERRVGPIDPVADRSRYAAVLRAFLGFYGAAERAIPAYGDDPSQWLDGDRRKSAWLTADLDALGVTTGDVPGCPDGPWQTSDPAARLGCMYVLEGSTLGGQYMVRQWSARSGGGGAADAGPAADRFFTSYGDDVGSMWRRFTARLAAAGDGDPDAGGRIARAADATFHRLDRWLAEAGL